MYSLHFKLLIIYCWTLNSYQFCTVVIVIVLALPVFRFFFFFFGLLLTLSGIPGLKSMTIFITLDLFCNVNKKQWSSNEILQIDPVCVALLSPGIPLKWPKKREQYMFGRWRLN